MPHSTRDVENSALEPVAICGMACRLPGGVDSSSTLWDMLVEKRDGQTPKVPDSRFNIDAHFHENLERPGSFNVMGGYFLRGDPRDFDPTAFNITPIEAQWLDPQQRKILEVTYECFESAGLPLEKVAGSNTAVFIGSFTSDYQQMSIKDPDFRHNYAATGVDPGIISNRVGNIFNLNGPSFTINTACSSSVYAIHNACHALRARDCDAAIAGGVNLVLTVDQHMNTAKLGILSPTSFCHTFDASADGYGRAEGAGALYLKRLSDAIRDGDPIRGVIRSSAVNTNGKVEGMGITHPSAEGQERVVRAAYKKANLDPNQTLYAELHGTGTPVGDPIEVRAVSNAMNDTRDQNRPLLIGAVKPNLGHSEAASGIFAVMKAALMTENGRIPGIARFNKLNPEILEDDWNVRVTRDTMKWPGNSDIRRASVSSFGYGGTNGHVIIESVSSMLPWYEHGQPKISSPYDRSSAKPHLICLSAHDKPTLVRNAEALGEVADKYYVSDLAYTLNVRRSKLSQRAYAIATDGAVSDAFAESALKFGTAPKNIGDVAFMFTGQGAQWTGMARKALQNFSSMQTTIKRLDKVLQRLKPAPNFSLLDLLLHGKGEEELNRADLAQPACTAIQIAIVDLISRWGIQPSVTVGHSSGEIGAAYAAGLISAPEAMLASYCRGQAVVNSSSPGMMLAVGLGVDEVAEFLPENLPVYVACENSPVSVTLSGETKAVGQVKASLEAKSIFVRELQTGRAYHTPLMNPVGEAYEKALAEATSILHPDDLEWIQPTTAMISSVTGEKISSPIAANSPYWSQNLRNRVRFHTAVASMGGDDEFSNVRAVLEIGPHSALAGPFKQICIAEKLDRYTYIPSFVRKQDDAEQLLGIAGSLFTLNVPVDLDEVNREAHFPRGKTCTPSLLVDLPPYQWNYANEYWAEARASAEQRHLTHPRHDLLGSRISGLPSRTGIWRNVLRLRDVPWLKDHSLGNIAVFPAAGHMSLAIEALRQLQENDGKTVDGVTLRDLDIATALVVPEDDNGIEVHCELQPMASSWWGFTIESHADGKWTVHCTGKIIANHKVETSEADKKSPVQQSKLTQRVPAKRWYNAFHRVGFQYGPHFQQLQEVRSNLKLQEAAASVKVLQKAFEGESRYVIHPSTIDACLQLIIISIHAGGHKEMPWGVVPIKIDEVSLWFPGENELGVSGDAVAWTSSSKGRYFDTQTKLSSAIGQLILDVKNLRCVSYEAALPPVADPDLQIREPYSEPTWKPDLHSLKSSDIARCWPKVTEYSNAVALITHLANHRRPLSQVTLLGDHSKAVVSSILEQLPRKTPLVMKTMSDEGHSRYEDLLETDKRFSLSILPDKVEEWGDSVEPSQDIVFVEKNVMSAWADTGDLTSLWSTVSDDGLLMTFSNIPNEECEFAEKLKAVEKVSKLLEFNVPVCHFGPLEDIVTLYIKKAPQQVDEQEYTDVTILRSHERSIIQDVLKPTTNLQVAGKYMHEFDAESDSTVIIDATEDIDWTIWLKESFEQLKAILGAGVPILWITKGVKEGSSSFPSMSEGFLRVIRSEQAAAKVVLMDFDMHEPSSAVNEAIRAIIPNIPTKESGEDTEFWLRGGVLHTCRVMPNSSLNSYHFGALDTTTEKLPTHVPLRLSQVDGHTIFTPTNINSFENELLPNQIDVQVEIASSQNEVPCLAIGTVIGCGASCDKSLQGKKVVAYATSNDQTIVRTSIFAVIDDISDPSKLLANLPALCVAVNACLKAGQLEANETLLLLPGPPLIISAIIKLCKRSGWNFKLAAIDETNVAEVCEKYNLSQDAILEFRSGSTTMRDLIDDLKPSAIIGHNFSPIAQEAWRYIPVSAKLIMSGSNVESAPDALPLTRGTSLVVSNTTQLFEESNAQAQELLATSLKAFKLTADTGLNERAAVYEAHAAPTEASDSTDHSDDETTPKVMKYDYTKAKVDIQQTPPELRFSQDATYILVGCLGGLGRSLTTWMRERGAQNFVFMSRSGADKPEAAQVVKMLKSAGASVTVHRADASNEASVAEVVRKTDPKKPIKGVIHAAMVLKDGMYDQMPFSDFKAGLAPKVDGALSLQKAVAGLDLDFFVMTSSISAVLGNPGQANYAAANSFLDQVAWQRNLQGQAATSLILPMVLDVGVVAETEGLEEGLLRKGMYGIDEQEMLKGFEVAMSQSATSSMKKFGDAQVILGLEPAALAKAVDVRDIINVYWYNDARLRHIRHAVETIAQGSGAGGAGDGFASTLKAALADGPDAAIQAIVDHVMARASRILMVPVEQFEANGPSVASYGLDSMIGAEMRTWLFKEFGLDMPFQTLLAPTLTFTGLATEIGKSMGVPIE